MSRNRRFEDEPTTTKSLIIFGLLFLLFFSTSIVLTSYPQHIALNDQTVIQAIKFMDGNTVMIRGNQIQLQVGDSIPLNGRDYIKLTGNQIQVGKTNYPEAIRTVAAEWYQNTLFSQRVGTWNSNQVAQIVVDKIAINLIPVSNDIISVTAIDTTKTNKQNRYNIQFTQDTTYINEHGVMIRLVKKEGTVTASLIGIMKYNNVFLRII